MNEFASAIAERINIRSQQVSTVLELLQGGATIPFIARYRKDKTGALDETVIQKIEDEAKTLKNFKERKESIEKSIREQDKLSSILQDKLNLAQTISELEDIYLPYKPKRKTRAQSAREKGLETLALWILKQEKYSLKEFAESFVQGEVSTLEEALQGARDIIAEMINEQEELRSAMRKLFAESAKLESKIINGKETEAIKFTDYFEFSEKISTIPSHRILAILRGFMEGFLRMEIVPDEEIAITIMERKWVKNSGECSQEVKKAVRDCYRRLLQPGMESEFRMALKVRADEDAIRVFSENLRQLLLTSPLGNKRILAIDPGYRTGCKIVCLNEQGELEKADLIYIHEPNLLKESGDKIKMLVEKYRIEAFAIGDGTAGRETELFIKKLALGISVFLVNEDGASIYSASAIAREEFPDQDITIRGSVSIGRRLMDPLAELVKIDPKSIGVGQYQHDVNQLRLKEKLDQTVISCVNTVGVNLNTAGKHLLSYVSGIGESLAANIVKHRQEIGPFTDRKELLKVSRLGEKAFEQCAGFLRIPQGKNLLDQSAVHPEAYLVVERIAMDLGVDLKLLIGKEELINKVDPKKYISPEIGELTICDILNELKKPGLDPRKELESFEFAQIFKIEDVKPEMIVPGIVTNLTRFGAFVDIGVKQDGLVHVSEIANRYISDPNEVLKLNDKVQVKVMEVDVVRKRIALSIKQVKLETQGAPAQQQFPGKSTGPKKTGNEKQSPSSMADALSALKKKFGNQ